MRARDGRLKILDFGLARSQAPVELTAATRAGLLVGTPGYIAPEQLAGERGDARADVYAFGVLMSEYACGTHPFATGAARTVPAIGAIVAQCLRQSPDERFASAAAIVAALDGPSGEVSCRHACRVVEDPSARDHRDVRRGGGGGLADQGLDRNAGHGRDLRRASALRRRSAACSAVTCCSPSG